MGASVLRTAVALTGELTSLALIFLDPQAQLAPEDGRGRVVVAVERGLNTVHAGRGRGRRARASLRPRCWLRFWKVIVPPQADFSFGELMNLLAGETRPRTDLDHGVHLGLSGLHQGIRTHRDLKFC